MQEPNLVLFMIHIAGAAALLIWSVRLVRTGVERAFAMQLRLLLRRSTRSRALAAGTGLASAMMLQSSTAVAVLVTGFVSGGAIGTAAGVSILLGADVGSALVARLLLVKQTFMVPLLLLIGVALFLRSQRRKVRQIGRILIGLALVFVSLDMIRAATAPLVGNPGTVTAMQYLGNDPLTAFLIGAVFAWAVHSSVAAVLLFVTLVAQGVLVQPAAVAMVLGANLGGAVIAYVLTLSAAVEARRMIVSNLVLRGGGAALLLLGLSILKPPLDWLGSSPQGAVVNLHIAFNLGLALLALPVLGPVTRLAERLMQARSNPALGLGPVSALDPAALASPDRALSCAAREAMRMGETVEAMLRAVIVLYQTWDDAKAAAVVANDQAVRAMHLQIKLYLAQLNRSGLDEALGQRSTDLSTLAGNLEAASDAVARNLLSLARRLEGEGQRFSRQGEAEIQDFHDRVLGNVQLALSVMMTQNPDDARELVAQKESIRSIEQRLQRQHLGRLREGLVESIETSNVHQETLRALKQVNTAFSTAALPILLGTGDLLESRLAERNKLLR